MNGQASSTVSMTRQTKILLGAVALFALGGVVLRFGADRAPATTTSARSAPTGANAPSPSGASVSSAAENAVPISIMTTDTKALWLREVTDDFNAARRTTSAGRPITVTVLQVSSPEEFEKNLLDLTLVRPVLISPGDMSVIEKANQIREDRRERLIPAEDCPPIVWIPSGFAMWRPMAEALGWPDKPVGWKDIVELAAAPEGWAKYGHPEWGRFTLGHAHPARSTFGFNVLASLAYAAAGKTGGLTPDDVRSEAVLDAFRKVERETYHYGLSTSKLLNLMRDEGPGYLHAATSSETAYVYTMEHDWDKLRYPWAFIYPAEGTYWSDNPTCILDGEWVTEEESEAAKIYRDYLLAPEAQNKAVETGLRPAATGITLRCPICLEKGIDPRVTQTSVPPLPGVSGETHAAIIDAFTETKKKATVALLLDASTSMEGVAIKSAVEGAGGFIDRLHPGDEIEAYMFSTAVTPLQPSGRVGDVGEKLSQTINTLYADGSTALYDAICTAVQRIETVRKEDEAAGEPRLYAVVLLSDGKNTNSKTWKSESEMFACLPQGEDAQEVKVYTIAYGDEADRDLLKRIAIRTNGKTYIGNPENIGDIYLQISAEQ